MIEYILFGMIGIVSIIIIVLIGGILDSMFSRKICRECTSISKYDEPAHTQTNIIIVGETIMPQIQYIPHKYYIVYDFDGKKAFVEVNQKYYDQYNLKQRRDVCEHRGLFTGMIWDYTYGK